MPTNYRYQAITNTDNTDDDQAQLISSTTAISSTSFPGNLTTAEMILNSSRFTAEKCITVWLNVLLTIFTAYLMLCELNVDPSTFPTSTSSKSDLHRLAAFSVYVILLLLQSVFLVGLLRLYLPLIKLNYVTNILGIITSKVFLLTYGLSAIELEPKSFILLIYGLEFGQTVALHFLIDELTALEEAIKEQINSNLNYG